MIELILHLFESIFSGIQLKDTGIYNRVKLEKISIIIILLFLQTITKMKEVLVRLW